MGQIISQSESKTLLMRHPENVTQTETGPRTEANWSLNSEGQRFCKT